MVDFVDAGLSANSVSYLTALEQQRATHAAVAEGRAPDTVILLEHPSVYTAGKRTQPHERPSDGTPVIDVDRGGRITWHGPGQLIGYPIVRLAEPIDVVGYVRRLEELLIGVLQEYGIPGEQVEGRSGVWLRGIDKIAAIGVRVADGVTMHGFALNCSNAFDAYDTIVACGIDDAGVTSISRELGRTVEPREVAPLIARDFERVLAPSLAARADGPAATIRAYGDAAAMVGTDAATSTPAAIGMNAAADALAPIRTSPAADALEPVGTNAAADTPAAVAS